MSCLLCSNVHPDVINSLAVTDERAIAIIERVVFKTITNTQVNRADPKDWL